jgi:hypothetical protein
VLRGALRDDTVHADLVEGELLDLLEEHALFGRCQ